MTRLAFITLLSLFALAPARGDDLPPVEPNPAQITLNLAADSTLSRDGRSLTEADFKALLAATPKEAPVVIRAAKGVDSTSFLATVRDSGHAAFLADLPELKPGIPVANAHPPIDITLRADGYIAIGEETFTIESLQAHLMSLTEDGSLQPIRLRAEPETPANQISIVAGLLSNIGLNDIAIIAEGVAQPPPITIDIDSYGTITIGKESFETPALTEYLKGAVQTNPGQSIIIRADGETRHQYVMNAINACTTAGIVNVKLAPAAQ